MPLIKDLLVSSGEDLKKFLKKEFDLVILIKEGLFKRKYCPLVAFEIDGGEHIGSKKEA